MIILSKYRRGQIRGIDFSLSMIIFLLTMSQVLVLTSTFIESSRSFQSTNQLIEQSNNLALNLLNNPGGTSTSVEWAGLNTLSLDATWKFGLSNNQSQVDAFKLGRLANNSLSSYLIDYDKLQAGLQFNTTLSIRITTSIEVNLSSVIDTGSQISIMGTVSNNNLPISSAKIWLYVYSSDPNVDQSFLRSNSNGDFFVSISPTNYGSSTFFVITAIVKNGEGSQALDYRIIPKSGQSPPAINTQSIFSNYLSTSGNEIIVQSNQIQVTSTVNQISFYPTETGSNYTIGTSVSNSGTWESNLSIPPDGIVGILTHENDAGQHYVSYTVFPLIMDDNLHDVLKPNPIPKIDAATIQQLIVIRGIFFEFSLTTWRD